MSSLNRPGILDAQVKRQLLNIVSVLSLVLFLLAAVLWVRGFWTADRFLLFERVDREARTWWYLQLGSDCNAFQLYYSWSRCPAWVEFTAMVRSPPWHSTSRPPGSFDVWSSRRDEAGWQYAGFGYHTLYLDGSSDGRAIGWTAVLEIPSRLDPRGLHMFVHDLTLPFWLILIALGALPAFRALAVWRARRRRREGHCAKCGYDLRASSERCPECGTPIPVPVPEPDPRPSA
jgi:hypothetical protein